MTWVVPGSCWEGYAVFSEVLEITQLAPGFVDVSRDAWGLLCKSLEVSLFSMPLLLY